MSSNQNNPLSRLLPGSWLLQSRIDVTAAGVRHPDPFLGEDPIALLIYDRAGLKIDPDQWEEPVQE